MSIIVCVWGYHVMEEPNILPVPCSPLPFQLSGVTTTMCPAPVKMMAILRTWIKISMMTVLMTATLTDQMEKVKGMNLCTATRMKETTVKKRNQVCAGETCMVLISR